MITYICRMNIQNAEKRCLVFDDKEKQLRQNMVQFFKYQLQRLDIVTDQRESEINQSEDLDHLMHDFEVRVQVAVRLLDSQNIELASERQKNAELE